MSLYNIIFGQNPASNIILKMINLTVDDVGRFRDCSITEDEKICIYTRNGGDNRQHYMPDFSSHPNFLYDEDDDFDCTYASIYFSIPEKYKPAINKTLNELKSEEPWKTLFDGV